MSRVARIEQISVSAGGVPKRAVPAARARGVREGAPATGDPVRIVPADEAAGLIDAR